MSNPSRNPKSHGQHRRKGFTRIGRTARRQSFRSIGAIGCVVMVALLGWLAMLGIGHVGSPSVTRFTVPSYNPYASGAEPTGSLGPRAPTVKRESLSLTFPPLSTWRMCCRRHLPRASHYHTQVGVTTFQPASDF